MTLKLLMIGFDALDYELWLKYGKNSLRSSSPVRRMSTTVKITPEIYETGPSWTTIMTGQRSVTHGMVDGWGRSKTQSGQPSRTFSQIPGPYLWDRLNKSGLRCGVFNVPVTWPPKPINGFMVSGFPCPPRNITYPAALESLLGFNYIPDLAMWKNNLWDHNAMGNWRESVKAIGLQNMLEVIDRADGAKIDVLKDLVNDSGDLDALVIQFSFVDRVGHVFGMKEEEATLVYPYVSRIIERLLTRFPADLWAIVSDHGMKGEEIPYKKSNHTLDAVFVVGKQVSLREGGNFDVLPTILELMNLESDGSMDGKSLVIPQ
jgi:predicted AlkP superfamily phosphohydrolase/phosphomutase